MHPTENDINRLIQRWYDAANQVETTTDQRLSLYRDTENLANYLETNKNSSSELKEKTVLLARSVLQAVVHHSNEENQKLINLISRHTYYKSGPKKEVEGGAFISLHHLYNSVLNASENNLDSPEIQLFASIASTVPEYGGLRMNPPLTPELASKLSVPELHILRSSSMGNKQIANQALISKLNRREIHFSQLKLRSISEIMKFFGKKLCSSLAILSISKLSLEYEDKNCYFSADKISDYFPNLISLEIKWIPNTSSIFVIEELELANLTHLKIEADTEHIIAVDLSCVEELPELLSLNLNCPATNISSLENCKKLTTLCLYDYIPDQESSSMFKSGLGLEPCSTLEFLNKLRDITTLELNDFTTITNFNFISQLPRIEKISLRSCTAVIELNLSNLSALKECNIVTCASVKKINLNNCAGLERLVVSDCHQLINIENEQNKNLKEVQLYGIQINDIRFLINSSYLTKLSVRKIIGKETVSFKNIEFFSLESLSFSLDEVRDTDFLENCRVLKELFVYGSKEINLKFVEKLPSSLKKIIYIALKPIPDKVIEALKERNIKIEKQ